MNELSPVQALEPPRGSEIPHCKGVAQNIRRLAKKIFEAITFPFRLLGPKTFSPLGVLIRTPVNLGKKLFGKNSRPLKEELWSRPGYHRFRHTNLSNEEAKEFLLHASAAAATQRNKWKWIEPFGFQPVQEVNFSHGMKQSGPVFFDPKSGLKMVLYRKENELLVSFGALGSHATEFSDRKNESDCLEKKLMGKALASVMGSRPSLYQKAEEFVQALRASEQFSEMNLTLSGQCLGGAITQYVALRQEIKGVALNSFPLGPGLQKKIGSQKLRNADALLQHVIVKGDVFSNLPKVVGVIDSLLSFIGFKTAANFGKKSHLPSMYKTVMATHYHVLGSLFAHWKPDYQELCREVISSENTKEKIKALAKGIAREVRADQAL